MSPLLMAGLALAAVVVVSVLAVYGALAAYIHREARQPLFAPYAPSEPARRWRDVRTRDRDPDTEEIPALTGGNEYQ